MNAAYLQLLGPRTPLCGLLPVDAVPRHGRAGNDSLRDLGARHALAFSIHRDGAKAHVVLLAERGSADLLDVFRQFHAGNTTRVV